MKYIMMFGSVIGWVFIFTFVIGFIAAPFSYFSGEIDSIEFLFSIIAFPLLSLLFYYLFPLRYKKYKVDQLKKSLEKEKLLAQKELDRKAEEKQRALDIKKAKEKKEKKLALLKAKSSEEVWASFNKKKVWDLSIKVLTLEKLALFMMCKEQQILFRLQM